MSTRPPLDENFTAFESRFQMICCSRSESPVDQNLPIRIYLQMQADALGNGTGPDRVHRAGNHHAEIDDVGSDRQLAGDDP